MRALFVRLNKLGASSLTVGIHKTDGSEQHSDGAATIADIGLFHEFGTKDSQGQEIIPERSWLRATLDGDKVAIQKTIKKLAQRVVSNKMRMSPRTAVGIIGLDVQRRIQARIRKGIAPELSPATLAQKKGKDIPLIRDGQFIQSISFEVL